MPPKKIKLKKEEIEISLKPNHELPLMRIHSNHVEVFQSPNDFTLKFCDATPIYNMDEVLQGGGIHEIPIVAEIAISFELMPRLISALQGQYKSYQKINKALSYEKKK